MSIKRTLAMFMCAMIIGASALSVAFIVIHASHDCDHTDCPECQLINYNAHNLSSAKTHSLPSVPPAIKYDLPHALIHTDILPQPVTPVTLKVQMNN